MTIRDATDFPRAVELRTDVCVVGGGPAGIAFSIRLAETTGLSVILLESGGTEPSPEAQTLNEGESIGLDYYDLTVTRHRVLGGSSHKWAGWCRPQDPIDFDGRSWLPDSGWPVSYSAMVPYFDEAAQWCQLDNREWTLAGGSKLPLLYLEPFIGNDVEIALWQGSPPTKFGHAYRDRLESNKKVTVITDATAVSVLSDNGRATGVEVRSLSGNEFTVSARAVVLSAGGLETPRLLLASRDSAPNGLGNENDNVGRYFAEHPHLVTGKIELFTPGEVDRPLLEAVDKGLGGIRARLALQRPQGSMKVAYTIGRSRQEKDQLLNFSTHLQTVSSVSREDSDAYQAFKLALGNLRSPRRFLGQIRSRSLPDGSGNLLRRLIRGAPEIWKVIYHEALHRPTHLALYTQSEQSPNRDSRITIIDSSRDALGMPRLQLDWRLSRIDKESVARSQQIIGLQLERAGLGRLIPEPFLNDESADWGPGLRGGHHQIGTARMSTDPTKGVVDPNGRVHTVQDLYIADASVFPVGGYANPLLTLVAWSLRLADHVGSRYSSSTPSPARSSEDAEQDGESPRGPS